MMQRKQLASIASNCKPTRATPLSSICFTSLAEIISSANCIGDLRTVDFRSGVQTAHDPTDQCAALDRDFLCRSGGHVSYVASHLRLGFYGVCVGHTTLALSARMDSHVDASSRFPYGYSHWCL